MKLGTILAVDDEPQNLKLLLAYLKGSNYEIVTAADGVEAWNKLDAEPKKFDAILLDRMMPHMNGMEVLAKVKAHPHLKTVPVIMQTAAVGKQDMLEGLRAGAHYYLTKPFEQEVLLSVVRTAVADHTRIRQLQSDLQGAARTLALMDSGLFRFRTLEEGQHITYLVTNACPEPARAVLGLSELIINAVEHGSLGITYDEKSTLNASGQWLSEVKRRQTLPENADKYIELHFERLTDEIRITIKDQGAGFKWQDFLEMHPDRAFDNHGRGIATARLISFDDVAYQGNGNTVVATIRQPQTGNVAKTALEARPDQPAIFSDSSAREAIGVRLLHLSQHDALTNLPNRTLLHDRLTQALTMAERYQQRVALMAIDLDRFKTVNDSLGHSVGDKLLQKAAERLTECLRRIDTVSRQGGDEFVILLQPGLEGVDTVAHVAEKILATVSAPYTIDNQELNVTASVGISVYPDDGRDIDSLLKNADAAMYHAKESGRNNFQFFTRDMNAMAFERLTLENSLRQALKREEFLLHYQPQVDLRTGEIIGCEALIRWKHPELGMISPAKFIPVAEDSGLIVPIGEWVMRTACEQNSAWQKAGLPVIPVAVNLSATQFRQKNLPETVAQALHDTGLAPRYLELELTESVIMRGAEETISLLNLLKGTGTQLSIDDFGTGYSSLSYLKRFPIDKLKVDQSFIRDITTDPDDAAIASAIISMAKSLKLKVIAEGVETIEQLEFLRSQQCDEIQGYYFCKPMAAEEIGKLLREKRRLQ